MRRALHSSHPDNLICREKEIAEIRSFLLNHLPKGKPGSLYISGAPGTGKTACLTRIMLEMKVNEMTMIKAKSLIGAEYQGLSCTFVTRSILGWS